MPADLDSRYDPLSSPMSLALFPRTLKQKRQAKKAKK
jgi:hypothetical protein